MRDRGDTRSPTVGFDDDVDWDGSPETLSGAGGAPSAAARTDGLAVDRGHAAPRPVPTRRLRLAAGECRDALLEPGAIP